MKVIVLYGPGEVGKRSELLRLKKQFAPEVISQVDWKQDGVEQLKKALLGVSLFDQGHRLVIVENTTDSFDLEDIFLPDAQVTLVVVISQLKATSKLLQSAKNLKAQVVPFEGEKELTAFPFLDNLLEHKKETFLELEKLLAQYGSIYVLTMMYYGLRRNILPLPASNFAREKISTQKKNYQTKDWENIYRLVLNTEYGIKSGKITEEVGLVYLAQKIIAQRYGE